MMALFAKISVYNLAASSGKFGRQTLKSKHLHTFAEGSIRVGRSPYLPYVLSTGDFSGDSGLRLLAKLTIADSNDLPSLSLKH
jgi:hypothetical protein